MFSLTCAWTNSSTNNGNAGDLRRHRAHYDVTLMRGTIQCPVIAPIGTPVMSQAINQRHPYIYQNWITTHFELRSCAKYLRLIKKFSWKNAAFTISVLVYFSVKIQDETLIKHCCLNATGFVFVGDKAPTIKRYLRLIKKFSWKNAAFTISVLVYFSVKLQEETLIKHCCLNATGFVFVGDKAPTIKRYLRLIKKFSWKNAAFTISVLVYFSVKLQEETLIKHCCLNATGFVFVGDKAPTIKRQFVCAVIQSDVSCTNRICVIMRVSALLKTFSMGMY